MNDSFSSEVLQSAGSQSDAIKWRHRSFNACGVITQNIRLAQIFATKIGELRSLYESANETLTGIVAKSGFTPNSEEEFEDEFSFESSFVELLQFLENLTNECGSDCRRILSLLRTKIRKIEDDLLNSKNDNRALLLKLEDREMSFNEQIRLNGELEQENQTRKAEIDALKASWNNNSFKQCVYEVGNEFSNAIYGCEFNSKVADTDWDPIRIFKSLSTIILKKKCENCANSEKQNKEIKNLLSNLIEFDHHESAQTIIQKLIQKRSKAMEMLTPVVSKNSDFDKMIQKAVKRFHKMRIENNESSSRIQILSEQLQQSLLAHSEICSLLGQTPAKDDSLSEFSVKMVKDFLSENAKQKRTKSSLHQSNIEALEAEIQSKLDFIYQFPPNMHSIAQKISFLGKLLNENSADVVALKSALETTISELSQLLKIRKIDKSVPFLLNLLPQIRKYEKSVAEKIQSNETELKKLQDSFEAAIIKLSSSFSNNSIPSNDYSHRILPLIDSLQSQIESLTKSLDSRNCEISQIRDLLEKLFFRISNVDSKDLSKKDCVALVLRIGDLIEGMRKNNRHSNAHKEFDLGPLFAPLFECIPLTSRSDPSIFGPEICVSFLSLHNSILFYGLFNI
jgi:hypothetical protein